VKMRQRAPSCERPSSSGQSNNRQPIATKPSGLRRIFHKLKRSNSGHSLGENLGQDSSSGQNNNNNNKGAEDVRETNNGWDVSRASITFSPQSRLEDWDAETVCRWFDSMGLYMYTNEVKKQIKSGRDLCQFSSGDLEAKLGIRHILHRKKVCLALLARQQGSSDPAGLLDHQWVTRWLDDVGLPQYKDSFLEARVDGRVLNFLTVDDLFMLKVTNQLHHLSIKHGIKVLRDNDFQPSVLRRRGEPGERESQVAPGEVLLWTNHRVMEWLRHVDLSEYAPNLRGSGVHGALLVLEARFTADLLASLLSIPTSKSLLRRHLSIHVKALCGQEAIQEKRKIESEPGVSPLTPACRARQSKKSQFTLRRKKSKTELDFEDMLCPIASF